MGYQQVKRFCWSGITATTDNHDNRNKHNNPVGNVPVQVIESHTTDTPDLPKKTNGKQDETKMATVESTSENTKKKSSKLHVNLNDDISVNARQGDDVVVVKDVTKPPEHDSTTNCQTARLNKQALSKVLEKIKSEENLEYQELVRRLTNKIKAMPKGKPNGDGKLVADSTSPINIYQITLNNELRAVTCRNANRLSSTYLKDSADAVVISLESSITSPNKKDSTGNIADLSRNLQLEPDSVSSNKLPKNQAKINDNMQSYKPDITGAGQSSLKSKIKASLRKSQTESKLETTSEWLSRLAAEYLPNIKSQENLRNLHESKIIPMVSGEQINNCSCLPAASRDWLLELNAKYNATPQNNQASLNNAKVELNNVSKVNSEDRSLKLVSADDRLAELRARFNSVQEEELNDSTAAETLSKSYSKPKTEQPEMQEKLNDQDMKSPSILTSEQIAIRSFKFNSSEELMMKLSSLPIIVKQVNREQNHELSKSTTEESDVEMHCNADLLALTTEQEKLVDGAFEPEPNEELLVERFNLKIHRRDLQTLSDLNWLNDEVINFYMNLIMQRSEERKDLPKVYATNTFFYPKLMSSGQAGLSRWTRKVAIFAYDLFVVPVNIGHHWCLSVVDFRERIIKYLDSRGRPNTRCLNALLQYLKDEHQEKKGAPFDDSGWKTECSTDIPQQMNGSDCGMFACTFAEFSSRGALYNFTQADMPYLRRKAALEILMGKLLL